jgi:transcriptional regulator with XRE-family HTH domain
MSIEESLFVNWREALRDARRSRGVSVAALAARSGLSVSAIKTYENGSRQPSQAALTSIIDALGIPREDANRIRAGAGYAVDWYTLLNERYTSDLDWLREAVLKAAWPVFVTNQAIDLVYWNRAFEAVWDVDVEREFPDSAARNFLAQASEPRFAGCFENYDECVTFMIGLAKGDPRFIQNPERPAPWLQGPLQRFLQGDPAYIKRFLELWEKAPPLPHRTRHTYDVRWLYRGARPMHFTGILTVVDIWNELSWTDWLPADGATWQTLGEISAAGR